MHQQPYFGGAAPPQWILDEARKKKPFANQKIQLRSESTSTFTIPTHCIKAGDIRVLNTDSEGRFKITLPPGTHKAFTTPHKDDFTIEVAEGKTLTDLEFFFVVSRPPGPLPP
jgi:hypothetical protein